MEQTILKAANKAIYGAINKELVGYNKPLSNFVNDVLLKYEADFKEIISSGVEELLNATDFKVSLKKAINDKLAKILIKQIGGELEKKVNKLKQDVTTRAKITLAINRVIEET